MSTLMAKERHYGVLADIAEDLARAHEMGEWSSVEAIITEINDYLEKEGILL